MNIKKGETRTEEFLNDISLNGKLPVLIIPKDYRKRTPLFPSSSSNPIHNAKIMQWLFWEQFSLIPNILPLRWWVTYLNLGDDPKYLDQIVEKQKLGYEALNLMETHLKDKEFFVDDKFTIADIALYANTHI
ncbi:9055_t:CDS:2, partial [Diversispora eburnea]